MGRQKVKRRSMGRFVCLFVCLLIANQVVGAMLFIQSSRMVLHFFCCIIKCQTALYCT